MLELRAALEHVPLGIVLLDSKTECPLH